MTKPDFRIKANQAPAAKAKQALMIAANELKAFTYYSPFQLGDPEQRQSVIVTVAELEAEIVIPDDVTGVHYLIVIDGAPVLLPEADVVGVVFGIVLARLGVDAARRVSYRPAMLTGPLPEMLPEPKE